MSTPTRRDRLGDFVAVVLIVAGVALYILAYGRLQDISQLSYRHPGPPSVSQLATAERARYLANGGVGLIVLGCVVGTVAAVRMARRKRPLPS